MSRKQLPLWEGTAPPVVGAPPRPGGYTKRTELMTSSAITPRESKERRSKKKHGKDAVRLRREF